VAVLAVSGLLGLALTLAVWTALSARRQVAKPITDDASANADASTHSSVDASAKPPQSVVQFNRHWLPEQTVLFIDLRMSRLAKQPPAMNSLALIGAWWQPSSQELLLGLNLAPEQVRRLTWTSTDLGDCAASCVVVLELEDGIDAHGSLPAGEDIDLGSNLLARRPKNNPWPHPLLAIDAHTIVTGNVQALRALIARSSDATLTDQSMERLFKKLIPDGDLTVMVDLSAARTADWKSPTDLLDIWPAGKSRWRLLCETPLALGLSVQSADLRRCELGLVCSDETTAENIRLDIEKFAQDAIAALPLHIAALKGTHPLTKPLVGVSEQYRRILDDLLAAMRTARCDPADGIVWVRFAWGGPGLLISAASAIESKSVLMADWMSAARTVDDSNQRGLLGALRNFAKAQNPPRFPEGAASGALMLKPETRLSWIAELLPYLGHADWHVEPGYDWNNAHNQVTKRTLPEAINPAVGQTTAPSGYPATHYVGMGGVGEDAVQLPADDPRAGMFGYGRQTRPQDLIRGGANTIAVLGVQEKLGPWGQGGQATVRPLIHTPYINGPDGFGSGQADGMVAGMADGSARFLSKDIDPHVMEQLAAVHGGDNGDATLADSKPPELQVTKPPAIADVKPPAVNSKSQIPPDPRMQALLNLPIAKISLPNVPLADAVQVVSAMSNLPISFDPDAMEELGVSLHDLVSIEVQNTTVGKALEAIAAQRNMTSLIENGQMVLTSTLDHRESLRPTRYAVSDLTGSDARAAKELAGLVQRLVVPESWQASGGRGTVETEPDILRITQTGRVHYRIIVFCEKLRVARGLPTKSRLDPKQFVLTTRTAQAKAILDHITSVNVSTPAALGSILDQFKQPAGTEILIDRPALAGIGISENTTGKFRADKLPQGEALQQLLEPLALAWRAVNANTLQVTTQKLVAARMELEFYPVGRLLAGQPPAAWIERAKKWLPEATWGESSDTGAMYFDPPSQCLIVLQPQPLQMKFEGLLAK
jgi:hypothetical protein